MARVPVLALIPLIVFAGLAGLFIAGTQRDDPDAIPSTREGLEAPAVTAIPVADFPTFDDADLRASGVKIVNFWASWCAPCRAEHPNLIALSARMPVYGINRDRTDEDAVGFLTELGNPFTAIVADTGRNRQSIDWGVYALPESFVLDGEGRVILHFRGAITQRTLESDILPAIARATGG